MNQNRKTNPRIRRSRLLTSLAAALLMVGGWTTAAEPAGNGVPPSETPGALRVLNVGNSHSHYLRIIKTLAQQTGHTGYVDGELNILGASLHYIWDNGVEKDQERTKFAKFLAPGTKWDALTLLSWDSGDEKYALNYVAEVYKENPKCQVYIYTIWPDIGMDFDNPPLTRTEAHSEAVAAAIAKAFPDAPKPRVIPSSLLIREIGRLAERGELPGVENRSAMTSDGGHLSAFGRYAIDVLVCSMLYNESPLGYPSDVYLAVGGKPNRDVWASVTVPEETAAAIKRTAWDILQTYPPAGMKPELIIADRELVSAIAGKPYKAELHALNAQGRCAWSLVKGSLPAGIALSAQGVVSGQTKTPGDYPITLRLVDGKNSFERPLTLNVSEDKPPVIADLPFPPTPLDVYQSRPLKANGGIGHISWNVLDEKQLPYGILLTPGGILMGTPGEAGEFTFTVKATDSNPAGARSCEKTFTWKIGPARPDSLMVKYARQPVIFNGTVWYTTVPDDQILKIDGKLEEACWKEIPFQPIAKAVQGAPTAHAEFAAVWTCKVKGLWNGSNRWDYRLPAAPVPNGDKYGLAGDGLVLAFKVHDGPKGKTPKDGIHIYTDCKHDGRVVYGAHNMHFFISRYVKPGYQGTLVRGLKPPWFMNQTVTEIEGGYTVEVVVSGPNWVADGQWLPMLPRSVYGLDVSVDEGEEGKVSQQVWHGDANDAEDTSHFGTIILTSQPVIGTEPTLMPTK